MGAAKVATRPVRTRRPREHDSGHVLTGIGHSWRCSCGETGPILPTWREAMQAGREHAAQHEAPKDAA